MAIDTRQKRFSMMSFGSPIRFYALNEADGSVDADDRSHLLNLYSGIALDGAPEVAQIFNLPLMGVGS
jgi:hypothetical protein